MDIVYKATMERESKILELKDRIKKLEKERDRFRFNNNKDEG